MNPDMHPDIGPNMGPSIAQAELLIRNGRVLDPSSQHDKITSIHIKGRYISSLGEPKQLADDCQIIDAKGCWVIPGLVDLSARLREPGQEQKANIDSETRAAAAGGITTLCSPPDTDPVIDTPAMVELLRRRAKDAGHCWVLPIGALTEGLAGQQLSEMAELKDAGCIALSNAGHGIKDTRVLLNALQYARSFDITVFVHAQDPWLIENGKVHDGDVATRLGLPGLPEATETAEIARILTLAQHSDARIHFERISSARSVELISAARRDGLRVSCDVSIHHLFHNEADLMNFDSRCYTLPPFRTQSDQAALLAAVADGRIDAVCSDHQPHDPDAKNNPLVSTEPGIAGLETLLPLMLRLVQDGKLTLLDALQRVTQTPAEIIGSRPGAHIGSIAPGQRADLCIIDPDKVWNFDTEASLSRGKNSPYQGWEFTGSVRQTVFEGRTVYDRNTEFKN